MYVHVSVEYEITAKRQISTVRNGTLELKNIKVHFKRRLKRMLKVMYKFHVDCLGSHPPTGQTISDRITESSVVPPRENSLDLLPVRHYGCN